MNYVIHKENGNYVVILHIGKNSFYIASTTKWLVKDAIRECIEPTL